MANETPAWNDVKHFFVDDAGSLVDVVVSNTTQADWARVLFLLSNSAWPTKYTEAGKQKPLPTALMDRDLDPLLEVRVGDLLVNCHFFSDEEIEFDIDPVAVSREGQYKELIAFMRAISAVLGKPVCLTGEIVHEHSFLCVP